MTVYNEELIQFLLDDLDVVESELISLNKKIERAMTSRAEIKLALDDLGYKENFITKGEVE